MKTTAAQTAAILARLPIRETLASALQAAAADLATAIRGELGVSPGGPHDVPWRQTGRLQGSIAYSADGLDAAVGTNDPAAAPQELGTARIPPRPFLAPSAAALGETYANDIGVAVARIIAGEDY